MKKRKRTADDADALSSLITRHVANEAYQLAKKRPKTGGRADKLSRDLAWQDSTCSMLAVQTRTPSSNHGQRDVEGTTKHTERYWQAPTHGTCASQAARLQRHAHSVDTAGPDQALLPPPKPANQLSPLSVMDSAFTNLPRSSAGPGDPPTTPTVCCSANATTFSSSLIADPSAAPAMCPQPPVPDPPASPAPTSPTDAAADSRWPTSKPNSLLWPGDLTPATRSAGSPTSSSPAPLAASFYKNLPSPPNLALPSECSTWHYDPDFGAKVSRQYKQNLELQRMRQGWREKKYGATIATAYRRGWTPEEVRAAYELASAELTRRLQEETSSEEESEAGERE